MSEQARLVSVEIESEPTLLPQFSPARFVGEKRSEPWKRVSFEPGRWGWGGGLPYETENKRRRRNRRLCSEYGLSAVLTVCKSAFSKPVSDFCWSVGRRTRSRLIASLVCPVRGISQLLSTVHRLQKVRTFVYSSTHE